MQCVFMPKNPAMVIHSALFNLVLVLTVYTVNTVSNCFTLLKQKHVCLNMLEGEIRTLLEWADGLLSKEWEWMDAWVTGWIPLRLL